MANIELNQNGRRISSISLLGQQYLAERLARLDADDAAKAAATATHAGSMNDAAQRIAAFFANTGSRPQSEWTFLVRPDSGNRQQEFHPVSPSPSKVETERIRTVETSADDLYALMTNLSQPVKPVAMRKAAGIVRESSDPHEIAYYTQLFASHIGEWQPGIRDQLTNSPRKELYEAGRDLAIAAATNPNIDRRTQMMLATESVFANDPKIQHSLAHNRILEAQTMRLMLDNNTNRADNIRLALVMNAVRKSNTLNRNEPGPYSEICEDVAKSEREPNSSIQLQALRGVRNEAMLRETTEKSLRFLRYDAVSNLAENPTLPTDAAKSIVDNPLSKILLNKDAMQQLNERLEKYQQHKELQTTLEAPTLR